MNLLTTLSFDNLTVGMESVGGLLSWSPHHEKPRSYSCSLHMCSSGIPFLWPKAYKAMVGGVSFQCGIEQFLED